MNGNTTRPKISVVIPTYRRPELLLRCIKALGKQDFPRQQFEIIVVSDGPDDETLLALKSVEREIPTRFLPLPKKGGPAAARNHGWRSAAAEFIAFTDDDCIPDQSWLSTLYRTLVDQNKELIALSGETVVPISEDPTDYEKNISHLSTAEFITANCACSRLALELVGGFDEEFKMAWREDSDLQFKLIQQQIEIVKVHHAIVVHPVRHAQWGVCIKEEKKGVYNALLFKKYPQLYREKIERKPPLLYYAIVSSFVTGCLGTLVKNEILGLTGLLIWLVLTAWFILKRLSNTCKSISHCLEMIFTSMVIPFLSLYWRYYGAVKYRAPLIP
jgi:glycosyltransferase involved in cell wall biosynthesis